MALAMQGGSIAAGADEGADASHIAMARSEAFVVSKDGARSVDSLPPAQSGLGKNTDAVGGDGDGDGDESKQRFSSRIQFLFSIVGFAVGIGNVWRFPYLCYRYGGGVFLIPYILSLFVIGFPLVFTELTLGQMMQCGPRTVWARIHPWFKGVGIASIIICFLVCSYYNIVLAWSLYYLARSFASPVPWKEDASEFYFTEVLHITEHIGDFGGWNWRIMLCLMAVWVLIYFAVFKGVQWSGKVAVFTVALPYVLLLILLIRGATLPGAGVGIKYYLKPDFSKMSLEMWVQAATQILYSLSPCFGVVLTFGAYLDKGEPTMKDAVIVTVVNTVTSLIAGFVVFSVLGNMATEANLPMEEVVDKGPGLAFITYPEALARLPVAPFFSVLFFVMLLLLGMSSVFAFVEVCIESAETVAPFKNISRFRRELTSLFFCSIFLILGMWFCFYSGQWWLELLDHFVPQLALLVIGLVEAICIGWVYPADRFVADVKAHTDQTDPFIVKYVLRFVTPPCLLALIVLTFVQEAMHPFVGSHVNSYPTWSVIVGWLISFVPVCAIIFYAVRYHLGYASETRQLGNKAEQSGSDVPMQVM